METKVTTVIVNATKQGLTMKVGNRHCYAKLTSFKEGGEYHMQIDLNWTYQEFLLQDKSNAGNQLSLNSDDCCDYERITVKEKPDGRLEVDTQLRQQFRSVIPEEEEDDEKDSNSTDARPKKLVHARRSWKAWLFKSL